MEARDQAVDQQIRRHTRKPVACARKKRKENLTIRNRLWAKPQQLDLVTCGRLSSVCPAVLEREN